VTQVRISGATTAEEIAAIVAAVDVATPRAGAPVPPAEMPRCRWSGRWWSRPIPQRRVRPW